MPAPKDKPTRKNLEAFFIAVQKPSLNEQLSRMLTQKRGVTKRNFIQIF